MASKALIQSVRSFTPRWGQRCFLADSAILIGDVLLGDDCSIWYQVTLRGDVMPIRVGREVNIQDGSVVHGTFGEFGVTLDDRVTIGHAVILHGCKVGRESLIGMGSIVMDGVEIGEQSLVGAGSLVTEGSKFPPRSLILGRPARVKRELNAEEIASLAQSADNYLLYKQWYSSP